MKYGFVITYTSYKVFTDHETYDSIEKAAARVAQLTHYSYVSNIRLSTKEFPDFNKG